MPKNLPRRTVDVAWLVSTVNDLLRDSEPDEVQGRTALCIMLERVLHHTNLYNGFNYLPAAWKEGAAHDGAHNLADESKRFYYKP